MTHMPQQDTQSWSRRRFLSVAAAGAAGFALAVPVLAERIVTPSDGLETADVQIKSGADMIPLYIARPAAAGKYPLIVVVHEIFGAHEHIKDVGRRFAQQGYVALVPELYSREGGVGHLQSFDDIRKVVQTVPDAQVMQDLDAAVVYAQAQPYSQGDSVGVTGFCWGGRITWLYAAHNPKVKAGVAWYGRLVAPQSSPQQPKDALSLATQVHCPVLGLYGGADQGIPVEDVKKMEAALKAANKTTEIVVYPDTPHAFFADYRPSYRDKEAKDAWQRALAWFGKYLKA